MTNKRLVWYLERERKIDDRQLQKTRKHNQSQKYQISISKIIDGFRRRVKTAPIFFNIEKTYDRDNRDKKVKQLENMGIQRTEKNVEIH